MSDDAERTWEIAKGMMRLLSGYVDIRDRLFALPEFLAFCHERERDARLAAYEEAAKRCEAIGSNYLIAGNSAWGTANECAVAVRALAPSAETGKETEAT